jgi:hypothetical protein
MAITALLSAWIDENPIDHWDASSTGGLILRLRVLADEGEKIGQIYFEAAATPDGEQRWSDSTKRASHAVLDDHFVAEHPLTAQELPDEILASGEIWLRAVAGDEVLALARISTAAPPT